MICEVHRSFYSILQAKIRKLIQHIVCWRAEWKSRQKTKMANIMDNCSLEVPDRKSGWEGFCLIAGLLKYHDAHAKTWMLVAKFMCKHCRRGSVEAWLA